jgi:hypothetical protein
MWVIIHQFGVKMDLCNMKKTIALFIILITLSGCFTYVPLTGRFYPRQHNMRPYHRFGINGYRIPQQRYQQRLKKVVPRKR